MNIAILTQPLLNNYGCLLQNYALQQTVIQLGHNPITIDFFVYASPIRKFFSFFKSVVLFLLYRKKFRLAKSLYRKEFSALFVKSYLNVSAPQKKYHKKVLDRYRIDSVLVGSDQVWRPKYNSPIEDMYLSFIGNLPVKRIAYAASFGVDSWEYSSKQTKLCSALAKRFDAISVREKSGVPLCKDYLGVDATWVLDPTLLLKKEDYLLICKDVPVCNDKYIAVYVLDENAEVTTSYKKEAVARGLIVKKFHAGPKSTLTVPEWLAMFRDASYVVTDSFHGTVFSIIFGKEFKCLYNKSRGSARFDSLLKLYHAGKLNEMRDFSLNWLKNALEK